MTADADDDDVGYDVGVDVSSVMLTSTSSALLEVASKSFQKQFEHLELT